MDKSKWPDLRDSITFHNDAGFDHYNHAQRAMNDGDESLKDVHLRLSTEHYNTAELLVQVCEARGRILATEGELGFD